MQIRQAWINTLHRAATSTRKTRTLLTPVGLIVFAVFVGLFVAGGLIVDEVADLPSALPGQIELWIGVPVLVLGLVITLWSAAHFLRVKGTPVPFNPPPELVTSGPYRHVRNPMLSGVFLMLFGLGLVLDSFALPYVFVPLFVLANVWELKRIEEPELVKRLGAGYVEYRESTPMFIPRVRSAA